MTSLWRPRRKRAAFSTSSLYCSGSISLTHGALQRPIWCSRHGRVRLAYTLSSQVRSMNTRCSSWIDSLAAQALGNGPKYWLRLSSAPR